MIREFRADFKDRLIFVDDEVAGGSVFFDVVDVRLRIFYISF